MSRVEIKVITYDQERLNYFTDLMKKAQKRYDGLYKKFANSPYLWEETELLNDAGRELQFYKDVIALLKQGYHKQSVGEWKLVKTFHPIGSATTYGVFACSKCGLEKNFMIEDGLDSDYQCEFDKYCQECGAKMK